jgi:hypothetical protein
MLLARTEEEAGGVDTSKWLGLVALGFGVAGSIINGKVLSSWIAPASDTGQPRLTLTADAANKARKWNIAGWACISLGFAFGVGATLAA